MDNILLIAVDPQIIQFHLKCLIQEKSLAAIGVEQHAILHRPIFLHIRRCLILLLIVPIGIDIIKPAATAYFLTIQRTMHLTKSRDFSPANVVSLHRKIHVGKIVVHQGLTHGNRHPGPGHTLRLPLCLRELGKP